MGFYRDTCLILLLATTFKTVSLSFSNLYNSTSVACLRGKNHDNVVVISCPSNVSLVAVHRLVHGLTPLAAGCTLSADHTTCCPTPWQPSRDCVFSSDENLDEVRSYCDATLGCEKALERAAVGNACPPRNTSSGQLTYGSYSDFAFVEYSCIDTYLIVDVSSDQDSKTGQELFLGTNYPGKNDQHVFNTTRSCVIRTSCQHTLVFQAVDLNISVDASGNCSQTVILREGKAGPAAGSILVQLNCTSGHVADRFRSGQDGGVFVSRGSIVGLDLRVHGNNTGRMLLRVTASNDTPVTVDCSLDSSQIILDTTVCAGPPALPKDTLSPSFNSSGGCLRSLVKSVVMDCERISGLISVERIVHGVVPDYANCTISSPDNCCPRTFNSNEVCLFPSLEGLQDLRGKCDGGLYCDVGSIQPAAVGAACPDRRIPGRNITYSSRYSHFALVQYACINIGVLSDVCHVGLIISNKTEVYLETNVYHNSRDRFNTTCSCVISTLCGQRIVLHALALDLADSGRSVNGTRQCVEEVAINDRDNSSVSALLSCNDNQLDDAYRNGTIDTVFMSASNLVDFKLIMYQTHTGKLLFRVTATGGHSVNVNCGQTTALDVWDQHRCSTSAPPTKTTTPTTTATTNHIVTTTLTLLTSFTSATAAAASNNARLGAFETGVAAGVGVLAFLVVVFITVLIAIIYRSKRSQRETGQTNFAHFVPGEDSIIYSHHDNLGSLNDSNIYSLPSDNYDKYTYDRLQPSAVMMGLPPGPKETRTEDGSGHVPRMPSATDGSYQRYVVNTDDSQLGAVGGLWAGSDRLGLVTLRFHDRSDVDNQFNDEKSGAMGTGKRPMVPKEDASEECCGGETIS